MSKSNPIQSNPIPRIFIVFIVLAFTLGFFTPVLADYIGPNRSVTTASEVCKMVLYECMYVAAKGDYRYHRVEDWSCSNESKPWQAYENSTVACEPWNVGRTYYEQDYSVVTTTITHPEATITGALQNCTLQNGWCVTPPQLQITANEPVSGYHILLIEGIYNGEIFACAENPCTFPFATEGNHAIEYWALSSWGDSSRKGTMNIKVDTVAPNLNLLVNGTLGQNNWYVSNATIIAEGADGTSGIYEKVLSIDNGTTWMPSTTLTDGVYQVDIKITDNALNVSTASTVIQVDATTPTLTLTVSGTKGNNNYYISKPKISATTLDATSGVALVQVKIDNGNWIDANEITIEDGVHAYQFRAYDNAGNMTETPVQTIQVDTVPPIVEAEEEINLGDTLFFTLRDNGSGLWIERIVIEDEDEKYKKIVWVQEISGNKIEGDILWDGKFADKTVAGVGEYFITFKISDRAGNETFYTTVVKVNPLSYFQTIPEFIVPESVETSNESTSNEEEPQQSFGGITSTTNNETTTQRLGFNSSATAGTNANTNNTSNILWGTAAAAAIGMAAAYALEQQKKREEDEAAQIAQVTAEVESKNAAVEANRIAMIEQLKIRNWLQGQAALEAWIEQLESQKASEEDMNKLREDAGTKGLSAAMSHAENLSLSLAAQQLIHQQAYNLYRQGEYVSVPMEDEGEENPFAGVSAGGGVGSSAGGSKPLASLASDAPPNLWERIVNWANENIIQPVKEFVTETKKKSFFFYNASGENLIDPATADEILRAPDIAAMKTYIAAAINVQRIGTNWGGYKSGKGPAQLSQQQLDTPYGEGFECKSGECRGYGLGLLGANPYDAEVAVEGMKRRIQQVMEEAERLGKKNNVMLDATDKFIIAALSQNGSGFDLNDIQEVMKEYITDGEINWGEYFKDKQAEWNNPANFLKKIRFLFQTGGGAYDTQYMLERFYDEASALHENGYYLPENLDANEIEALINGSVGNGN